MSGLSTISRREVRGAANLSQANFGPLRHRGDVLDLDRCAVLRFDYRVLNVLNAAVEAQRLDIDLLRALLNKAAAAVGVVIGNLLLNLRNR